MSFGSNNSKNNKTCVESRYQIEDGDGEILKNSAKEYLKLIKGEKEMTKNDLKDGMVVEYRNGDKRLVLLWVKTVLAGQVEANDFYYTKENLLHGMDSKWDIVKIYKTKGSTFTTFFKNEFLELIWTRAEKSDAEIKLEQMENQIREIEQSCKELKKELNK